KPHGRGHLFGPGRPDGPLPEHYEPWESPVSNPMSSQQNNPAIVLWETAPRGSRAQYPIMATTHRLVEHMNNGILTRHMGWLVEMMPEMFIEISQELAAEKGIGNGNSIIVESARGSITGKAMVTMRIKPVHQNGSKVHYICLPWNWGYMGPSKGSITNSLTARVVDPNTGIPEFRSFLCNVRGA
ncbi:MAG: molybdopterin dinucleotide binding domain-containing protein, partial [Chloroflexota bacterium]|nr:molybdopterin dinucleotide binding domain-containing protein [Chloroflexota bacterium]